MFVLITYDITSDKKRNKVDKLLSSYGDRVNYSVFELNIRAHILSQLKLKLKELMDKNDSVRVYILNKTSAESAVELGSYREKPFELEASYV